MNNEENNNPEAATMILYGGAYDGIRISVKYEQDKKGGRTLPGAISIPVERKVIAPSHVPPVNEVYVLRELQFSKNAKFRVYISKGLSIEDFFTKLLQCYKPSE